LYPISFVKFKYGILGTVTNILFYAFLFFLPLFVESVDQYKRKNYNFHAPLIILTIIHLISFIWMSFFIGLASI